jgi:hypothetical protein
VTNPNPSSASPEHGVSACLTQGSERLGAPPSAEAFLTAPDDAHWAESDQDSSRFHMSAGVTCLTQSNPFSASPEQGVNACLTQGSADLGAPLAKPEAALSVASNDAQWDGSDPNLSRSPFASHFVVVAGLESSISAESD